MRGADITQEGLFVMKQAVDYIPAGHPLIAIREILIRRCNLGYQQCDLALFHGMI